MVTGQGGRVLIVEDDPGVAVLQQRRLQRTGYEVLVAANADEAFTKAQEPGVELMVLDYRLPGNITGLELFERIKAAGHVLPVIIVTGFSDESMVVKALRAGVRDFVTKTPEYLDYLPEAVQRVLKSVRTERQLAESEARLAGIINSAMDAILTMDQGGKVLEFNPAAEAVFGYQRDDVIGHDWSTLIQLPKAETPSPGRKTPTPSEHSLLNQRVEAVGRRKDGTEFPAELTVTSMDTHGGVVFTGFIRDISESKRAAEHIREQAALLDQANDAIMVRDLEGNILFWNKSAERLYGWTGEEAVGQNAGDLLFDKPSPTLHTAAQEALAKGEWVGEMQQVTKDRKNILVASRWTLVRNSRGEPKTNLIINTDITERKQLEAQFLRAQRLESLGTIAGGIAHDLNNVLTPILMATQLLQAPVPEQRRQSILESMRVNAERGADMVKQVLSFARGVEGQRVPIQLRSVIKEFTKMLQHTIPKSIDVRTDLGEGLWPVCGDGTQIYQVLMNLCLNARDAMPNGGKLTIAAQNATLTQSSAHLGLGAKPGPYVLVRITDTGTGIPEDLVDKIFDPFFTTKEVGKGTGLGLSTVMGIIRSHGGAIEVESKIGMGTTFAVYLPAIPANQPSVAAKEGTVLPSGNGELILVVDDEAAIRDVVRDTLETHGYRVLSASNGTDALTLFLKHRADVRLVFTDLMMPVMDGVSAIRALHSLEPNLRIVATSGLGANGKPPAAAQLPETAFLPKPFTADSLLKTLRTVLAVK